MDFKSCDKSYKRNGERGAALITTILLSTLLLAAGGTLILTSAMTGTNAVDQTAEMQAYYAAEAGISQALAVLRGNVDSVRTGTSATFKNIVSTPAKWTALSGTKVNVSADGSSAFQVLSVTDPDDVDGAKRTASALYKPSRLKIQVSGFRPRKSEKRMELAVQRYTANYAVTSTITMPNGSGTNLTVNLGSSNPTAYSGLDSAGSPQDGIAAFAISAGDNTSMQNVINGCQQDGTQCVGSAPNVTPSTPMILDNSNTPQLSSFSEQCAQFSLDGSDGIKATAMSQGRYFTNGTDAVNSPLGLGASYSQGALTFVDGDFVLWARQSHRSGHLSGNRNSYSERQLPVERRNYGPWGRHCTQKRWWSRRHLRRVVRCEVPPHWVVDGRLSTANLYTSGGGTANIQYNSDTVDMAKNTGGHSVVGIREYCFNAGKGDSTD